MTRRIFAGFLGVLIGLLALVVVPLGLKISSQQRHDFEANARVAARALANIEEERLGDTQDRAERTTPAPPPIDAGDGVVILDQRGIPIVAAGREIPKSVLDAVRGHRSPSLPDGVVVVATVGATNDPHGTVILSRSDRSLDRRARALWEALAAAAAVTLAIGAFIAVGLARWIGRPLHGLADAAGQMGHGDIAIRTTVSSGPPEVRAVGQAFNEMAGRIASLLDRQRAMTADVSHQLRTPLAALRLRLELLAQDAPDHIQTDLADTLREIARLNRLVDGLLAVARAEALTAKPASVDAGDLVTERAALWQPLADEAGVTLTSVVQPATVLATPGHLEQVLDNLLANAMDALSPGSHLNISVRPVGAHAVITVEDDGPGMTPERRASAFLRFEGDRSGRKAGLGLAIVARLVTADYGTVELDETSGGGLTVTVQLPATANAALSAPRER